MHVPDGFLNAATSLVAAGISASIVGIALRQTRDTAGDTARGMAADRIAPVAGVTGAFLFAAQMVNFPVGAGTSGHLIGGALAAILLGRSLGLIVSTVVVVVQALVFADGGMTAVGVNVLNLAVVPVVGGYALYTLARRLLPRSRSGVIAATAFASGASVVLGAVAFSLEWLFGAVAPVPFDSVFGAMVGVHLIIGIGEATISALIVSSVLAARPDLVVGARDLDASELGASSRLPRRAVVISGLFVAVMAAAVASQFSATTPDGLERVAIDKGFADTGSELFAIAPFAEYATRGIDNPAFSLAVAGVSGVVLTLLIGWGLLARPLSRRNHLSAGRALS